MRMEGRVTAMTDPDDELVYELRAARLFDSGVHRADRKVRDLASKLYSVLHRRWPCLCGESHHGKLGDLGEAKLRLGPSWNSATQFPGKFDIVLGGTQEQQECEICMLE